MTQPREYRHGRSAARALIPANSAGPGPDAGPSRMAAGLVHAPRRQRPAGLRRAVLLRLRPGPGPGPGLPAAGPDVHLPRPGSGSVPGLPAAELRPARPG